MKNILIAGGKYELTNKLSRLLNDEGYNVIKSSDALTALDAAVQKEIHLILLSTDIYDKESFAAILKVRTAKNIPTLFLTGKGRPLDINFKAEDCFNEASSAGAIAERVKFYMNRQENGNKKITVGGLFLDVEAEKAWISGAPANLTPTEYRILELLCKSQGRILSPSELSSRAGIGSSSAIAVHICHIREKIEPDPKNPCYIKSLRGKGYKV